MAKVVLIDHEMTMLQTAAESLRSEGHTVYPFANSSDALAALSNISPALVITNFATERVRPLGRELIKKAGSLAPPAASIVIIAANSIETALEAMRHGAFDYLEKPFAIDELKLCARRALTHQSIISENMLLRGQIDKRYQLSRIIGASPAILEVLARIAELVDANVPVLIQGPSGAGKELAARAIHFQSRRRCAPFIVVNCSSLTAHVLDIELFGSRSEAPNGAGHDRRTRFQEAEGGTILLDEIGSLPGTLQRRLLPLLSDLELPLDEPGSPVNPNVRILAATTEALHQKVREGLFSEELYGRLYANSIVIPPLCQRAEDIPLLIAHFLEGKVHRQTGQPLQMSREAIELCCAYNWPGHVRELENVIERVCAVSAGHSIQVVDLPLAIRQLANPSIESDIQEPASVAAFGFATESLAEAARKIPEPKFYEDARPIVPLKAFLRDQELAYLQRALIHADGSKEKAAELLGVSLATIYRKLSEETDDAAASADAACLLSSSLEQPSDAPAFPGR
jgi:DNA-binding NtrC family response regulator